MVVIVVITCVCSSACLSSYMLRSRAESRDLDVDLVLQGCSVNEVHEV